MPNVCPKTNIRGSGYVKPEVKDVKANEELQKLLEARAKQDAKYFPTLSVEKKVD
jgi:hypothetical protein